MLLAFVHILARTSGAVDEASEFAAQADDLTAKILAEELAHWLIANGDHSPVQGESRHRAGFDLVADLISGEAGDHLRIKVTSPKGKESAYQADVLAGAAPYSLGLPLSISRAALAGLNVPWEWLAEASIPEPNWLPIVDFPQVLAEGRAKRGPSPRLARMSVDPEIALLYLGSGTDLDDYRFDTRAGRQCRIPLQQDAWVVVDGNFWVADAVEPITIELRHHLTIIVHGNIYLGSSLKIRGAGRLTLVALRAPSHSFHDRDLNGNYSQGDALMDPQALRYHGWIEGSGGVYLGIPGRARSRSQLVFDGSLVAEGMVYLLASRASIGGALVIGSGFTRESSECRLSLPGSHLPETNREVVPGYVVTGEPRAGRLLGGS